MARFYGEVQGNRGSTSRLGSAKSGMVGHIRGWSTGCRVDIRDEDGIDVVRVWRTTGSNARGSEQLIATFTADSFTPEPLMMQGDPFSPVDVVDQIDELVNESLTEGRWDQR